MEPTNYGMNPVWSSFIAMLAERLRTESDGAALFRHKGLIGMAREVFVASLLRDLLPEGIGVGTGEVFDRVGKRSKQVDVVLYDKGAPIPRVAGLRLFPVESVIAAIEVKTRLNKDSLFASLDNCLSVVRLQARAAMLRPKEAPPPIPTPTDYDWSYPGTYIFAFENSWTDVTRMIELIGEWHANHLEPLAANRLRLPRVVAAPDIFLIRKVDDCRFGSKERPDADLAGAMSEHAIHVFVADLVSKVLSRTTSTRTDLRTSRQWTLTAALEFDAPVFLGKVSEAVMVDLYNRDLKTETREHDCRVRVKGDGLSVELDDEGATWLRLNGLLIGRYRQLEAATRVECLDKVELTFEREGPEPKAHIDLYWREFGATDDAERAKSLLVHMAPNQPLRLGGAQEFEVGLGEDPELWHVIVDSAVVGAFRAGDSGSIAAFVPQTQGSRQLVSVGRFSTEGAAVQELFDLSGIRTGIFLDCPDDFSTAALEHAERGKRGRPQEAAAKKRAPRKQATKKRAAKPAGKKRATKKKRGKTKPAPKNR